MKALTYRVAFACAITFFCCSLYAQNPNVSNSIKSDIYKANKRANNYQELLKLGYSDKEIYEDLGNANFLSQNYKTAVFWYKKLIALSEDGVLSANYSERYQYALQKLSGSAIAGNIDDKDWLTQIKADYRVNNSNREKALADNSNNINESLTDLAQQVLEGENDLVVLNDKTFNYENAYKTPITVTSDGNTAYFSKASYIQTKYGVFSKKQLVHKI
ncbi:MAG: cell envelope biogenesis protein OmpA, partial [Eudoraea sp.]